MSTPVVDVASIEAKLRAIIADADRRAPMPAEVPAHLNDLARLTRIAVIAEFALAEITRGNPIRRSH